MFFALIAGTLLAGWPEIQPPPAPYTDASPAIYSPSCGQGTTGCLKPGTYQLPYGTVVIHPKKKKK